LGQRFIVHIEAPVQYKEQEWGGQPLLKELSKNGFSPYRTIPGDLCQR
jgi:hypothetical protein